MSIVINENANLFAVEGAVIIETATGRQAFTPALIRRLNKHLIAFADIAEDPSKAISDFPIVIRDNPNRSHLN